MLWDFNVHFLHVQVGAVVYDRKGIVHFGVFFVIVIIAEWVYKKPKSGGVGNLLFLQDFFQLVFVLGAVG